MFERSSKEKREELSPTLRSMRIAASAFAIILEEANDIIH
jgi:hypothetical protein